MAQRLRPAGGQVPARYASPVTVAAALLVPSSAGPVPGLREAAVAAMASGADEVLVVLSSAALAAAVPEGATVLLDDAQGADEASTARVAADWSARAGHTTLVVCHARLGRTGSVASRSGAWAALVASTAKEPVLVGTYRRAPAALVRLDAAVWSALPLSGHLEVLWRARPELAAEVALDGAA